MRSKDFNVYQRTIYDREEKVFYENGYTVTHYGWQAFTEDTGYMNINGFLSLETKKKYINDIRDALNNMGMGPDDFVTEFVAALAVADFMYEGKECLTELLGTRFDDVMRVIRPLTKAALESEK